MTYLFAVVDYVFNFLFVEHCRVAKPQNATLVVDNYPEWRIANLVTLVGVACRGLYRDPLVGHIEQPLGRCSCTLLCEKYTRDIGNFAGSLDDLCSTLTTRHTCRVNKTDVGELFAFWQPAAKQSLTLYAGRTDGYKIAFFEGTEEDVGKFITFEAERADAYALYGKKV